ncbi:MAG: hypothetical protein RBS99_16330, partial [Rhodospirillales bacterium]|nr:hypothetical protein [Rhodospirillales bacterium]
AQDGDQRHLFQTGIQGRALRHSRTPCDKSFLRKAARFQGRAALKERKPIQKAAVRTYDVAGGTAEFFSANGGRRETGSGRVFPRSL